MKHKGLFFTGTFTATLEITLYTRQDVMSCMQRMLELIHYTRREHIGSFIMDKLSAKWSWPSWAGLTVKSKVINESNQVEDYCLHS